MLFRVKRLDIMSIRFILTETTRERRGVDALYNALKPGRMPSESMSHFPDNRLVKNHMARYK
ncbi:unnamed protein product [marine sediment metagenome]|uniref:Uncharacterized protein n=1 Tax=marine sediment metagenome TaxID=412755 RepID=X0SUZ2_9ZZZZ